MAQKFRKLDPRFWNDEKVQELSPEDKLVAIYCLTSPQANRIGLFCFSIGHAAEDTGIPPEGFREGSGNPPEGFRERFERVCRTLKWVFHEPTRTLYLPNWWKYNEPESINVLVGALKDIHDVPQSPLVQQFMSNEKYLKETLREPLANLRRTLGEPSPIQEQEQEQEQDSLGRESRRFKKPTLNEVRDHCLSRGNGIDPEEFIAHYESKGWKIGKEPMKDWRAAVVTWERKRKSEADGAQVQEANPYR